MADLFEQPEFIKNVIPFAMIAGVDGCKGGWIVAVALEGTTEIRGPYSFLDILQRSNFSLIVIDIPIGLLERDWRECDVKARDMLKPKRDKSVFLVPARPVVEASSYKDACRIGAEIQGKKPSIYAYGIFKRILEVDKEIIPNVKSRVREAHPEVCFAEMNVGQPLHFSKKTIEGKTERLTLLSRYFPDVRSQLTAFGRRGLEIDIIDAYACLWTAERINQGTARTLPDTSRQKDHRGLSVEIVV